MGGGKGPRRPQSVCRSRGRWGGGKERRCREWDMLAQLQPCLGRRCACWARGTVWKTPSHYNTAVDPLLKCDLFHNPETRGGRNGMANHARDAEAHLNAARRGVRTWCCWVHGCRATSTLELSWKPGFRLKLRCVMNTLTNHVRVSELVNRKRQGSRSL